jgi:hypothetical protein
MSCYVMVGLDDRVRVSGALGEEEVVEAGVGGGEAGLVGAVTRDDEVEVAEALDGDAVGAGAKEEEALLPPRDEMR